ncbi:MAG: outer membrane beta-barrel protein [Desulfobacteraceae bacterium]|nr:outer membrane beta-barrel protein [Desulfobacteraceae bacterium]
MLFKRKYLYVLLAAGLLFFIQPAWAKDADSDDKPWKKFNVDVGYFISNVDTNLSLGSGLGLTVNVEDLLGLDTNNNVFRIDAFWRFTDNLRHRFDFTWFSFRRDGSTTVGRDFTIKDKNDNEIEILAGTRVNSKFNLDIYRARYSYSFFQDDRMDLAFSIGAYVMPIDIGLQAAGLINFDETERFTAPLPTLGLRMDFAITPKWFLRSNFEIFYLEINEFTGTIYETNVAIEYIPWKHLGFGLAGNVFSLGIEADGEDYPGIDFKGELKFRYSGLLLYAKVPF